MLTGILLGLSILVVSAIVAYLAALEQSRYWLVGISMLVAAVLVGLNTLLMNWWALPISVGSLLIVFGVEDVIAVLALIWWAAFRKSPAQAVSRTPPIQLKKAELVTVLAIVCFVILVPLLVGGAPTQGFTEFYFQEAQYKDSSWRRTYSPSASIPLSVAVSNQETGPMEYRMVVVENATVIMDFDLGSVASGESLTREVVLPATTEAVTNYRFLLYKRDSTDPYRFLSIWVRREVR